MHALSFGLPVITNNNKSAHFPEFELLQQGINGDLFQDNSVEDLANKIIEWKNKVKDSKDKYINNCIGRIKQMEYLPDTMGEKIIRFLKGNN